MCFLIRMSSVWEARPADAINHLLFCPLFLDSSTSWKHDQVGNMKEIIRENILFFIIWKCL